MKSELHRKIFHVGSGFWLPALILFVPGKTALLVLSVMLFLAATGDLVRLSSPAVNAFYHRMGGTLIREKETSHPLGVISFILGGTVSLALAGPVFAAISFVPLLLGDTAAALVGTRWGRHKIVFGKSFEGLIAFFLVTVSGLAIISLFYPLSFSTILLISVLSGVAEVVSPGNSDNFTIPLVTGILLLSLG